MSDGEPLIDRDGSIDADAVSRRIDELQRRARADEEAFSPPSEPPDRERAMTYLRSGAGQTIALYAHLRTGGRLYRFSANEFDTLEAAMNTWFQLYAACHGMEIDPDVSLRTAAEAFVDTENIVAVARTMTGVPRE